MPALPIFNKKQYDLANSWIKPYINVPIAQMKPFLTDVFNQQLIPEPAASTQSVYHALNAPVEAVLTDRNANIPALLKQANQAAQQAISTAAAAVISGQADVVIAGGVEMMSGVPMSSAVVPGTGEMGGPAVARYETALQSPGFHGRFNQGAGAELIATEYGMSRTQLDEYALLSRFERLKYRLLRNPLVLFGLGPIHFILTNRILRIAEER